MHRQLHYQPQHLSHQQRPALLAHAFTSHHHSLTAARTSFAFDGQSDPVLSSGSSGTASDSEEEEEQAKGGLLGWNRVGGGLGGGTGESEPDPLAAQAAHAIRTLKRNASPFLVFLPSNVHRLRLPRLTNPFLAGSLMTHPTSDYLAFSAAQSTALDRAKQLLEFVSEDVPAAMLPQVDALEKRAEKTVLVLEGEKEKLVGAEAAARQKKANDLIAHLFSLHASVTSNRESLKTDLEALEKQLSDRLSSLRSRYDQQAEAVQAQLKDLASGGSGGGAGKSSSSKKGAAGVGAGAKRTAAAGGGGGGGRKKR